MDDRQKEVFQLFELTLSGLVDQLHSYRQVVPRDNPTALAITNSALEKSRQVQNEFRDLVAMLHPQKMQTEFSLTQREQEVLRLMGEGLANKEIAYRLTISERTVQFHIRSIFQKTDSGSRTGAIAKAFRSGSIK